MFCIGVSYKKASLEIRQQFAFSKEEQTAFLSELLNKKIITGGIIVSTCNRSEWYFTGDKGKIEAIEDVLSMQKSITKESIKKYGLYFFDEKAVRHLYKVACGLDSMVIGEDEILRQVKEAYLFAGEQGFTNSELNIIFQGAFNCAKLSKAGTRLSNTPVSIGTLTANTIEAHIKKSAVQKGVAPGIEDGFANQSKVLVIGASGKIGSIVAKDLIAKGISVIGTSRKRHHAEEWFLQADEKMAWLDFDRRYEAVSEVTAIVSATSSPHYTLTKEEFLGAAKHRNYLLIDLAVPYDIDKDLKKTEGITLLDIDYFKTLSRENSNIKLGEIDKVNTILQECVEEVLKKLCIRDFQEKMADKCEEVWFQKMTFYLREVLDSRQLSDVLARIYERES